jgi:hypothetical protein
MTDAKGNTFENELLEHILNNADIANIGDATGLRGSTTPGSLYVSLHTANPGEAGDQTTSEIAYTGYARQGIVRTGAAWTVTANSASPASNIDFPEMTGGAGGTVTYFAVGTSVSGAGKVLYYGTVSPNISVTTGVIPRLTTSTAITES